MSACDPLRAAGGQRAGKAPSAARHPPTPPDRSRRGHRRQRIGRWRWGSKMIPAGRAAKPDHLAELPSIRGRYRPVQRELPGPPTARSPSSPSGGPPRSDRLPRSSTGRAAEYGVRRSPRPPRVPRPGAQGGTSRRGPARRRAWRPECAGSRWATPRRRFVLRMSVLVGPATGQSAEASIPVGFVGANSPARWRGQGAHENGRVSGASARIGFSMTGRPIGERGLLQPALQY